MSGPTGSLSAGRYHRGPACVVADRGEVAVDGRRFPQRRLEHERLRQMDERVVGATGQALEAGEVVERRAVGRVALERLLEHRDPRLVLPTLVVGRRPPAL